MLLRIVVKFGRTSPIVVRVVMILVGFDRVTLPVPH